MTVIAVTVLLRPSLSSSTFIQCERKYHLNISYLLRRDASALVGLENALLWTIYPDGTLGSPSGLQLKV